MLVQSSVSGSRFWTRMLDPGCWGLDAGRWMLEGGFKVQGSRLIEIGIGIGIGIEIGIEIEIPAVGS